MLSSLILVLSIDLSGEISKGGFVGLHFLSSGWNAHNARTAGFLAIASQSILWFTGLAELEEEDYLACGFGFTVAW